MSAPDRIDRRHFAAQLALGASLVTAAVSPLASASAVEDKPAADKSKNGDKPVKKQPDEAAAPELPPAEVILLSYLTRRHPSDHYDEAAIQGIYRDIRGDIVRGKQLSEFPLKNSDEPAFVFAAFRATTLPEN